MTNQNPPEKLKIRLTKSISKKVISDNSRNMLCHQ